VQLLRTGEYHVGEIAEKLKYQQSRVSHNLACLLNCGFVFSEWRGKNKVYRLNPDIVPILTGIEKHLVRYTPALDSCRALRSEAESVAVGRELRRRTRSITRSRRASTQR
jgi:DNA-binding transcriptional ArsR family regulator